MSRDVGVRVSVCLLKARRDAEVRGQRNNCGDVYIWVSNDDNTLSKG